MIGGLILIILLATFGLVVIGAQHVPTDDRVVKFDVEGALRPVGSFYEYQGKTYIIVRSFEKFIMAKEYR